MDKLALSVDEFCHAHGLCRASFYNLLKNGTGPATMKVGGRTLVSIEAAAAWRRRMEAETAGRAA
jgi:predicted DNA-binding transcriptional regulator AlpA